MNLEWNVKKPLTLCVFKHIHSRRSNFIHGKRIQKIVQFLCRAVSKSLDSIKQNHLLNSLLFTISQKSRLFMFNYTDPTDRAGCSGLSINIVYWTFASKCKLLKSIDVISIVRTITVLGALSVFWLRKLFHNVIVLISCFLFVFFSNI